MNEPLVLEDESVRIHLVLNCENCDWSSSDYLHGDEAGREHADKFRHKVSGEYGIAVKFVP